ncbi:MAG: HTH domain-containing protein, partial [Candidatus Thiodiazotropha endolucinida]|nr:HTH domain-containing protein [Candidatus Thiodiazotropha taylori]MCW4241640.1 HTH domain-containing protein [Candidatus Thiodiazotropha taylori]
MRRADRLFRITQELSAERDITAECLAERLEVSVRTIYRDIEALSASGIPIEAVTGR